MQFKVPNEDVHPLANQDYSDFEIYGVIRKSMHQWPFGVLEMDHAKNDEYFEKYYKPEDHPFFKRCEI